MPEIQNNFSRGRMNKDLDERLIPKGEYRDALNIQISTSEGSDVGTVQNLLGNARIENVIGGSWTCIGAISDEKNNRFFWFVHNPSRDAIYEYNVDTKTTTPVIVDTNLDVLKFQDNIITGINIIDDILLWTDNHNEPRKINIERCKLGVDSTNPTSTHTKLVVNGAVLSEDLKEEHITVIKKRPNIAPQLNVEKEIQTVPTEVFAELSQDNLGQDPYVVGDTAKLYIPWQLGTGVTYNPVLFASQGEIVLLSQSSLPGSLPSNSEIKAKVTSVVSLPSGPGVFNGDKYVQYEIEILSINNNLPLDIVTFDGATGQVTGGLLMNAVIQEDYAKTLFTEKLIRFATRWKYEDGEYSAFSPFTQTAFRPSSFSFHPTKDTYNLGMQNNCKQIHLRKLVPPDMPEDVVQVDILFKLENSTTIYSIDSIKRNDPPKPGGSINAFNEKESTVPIIEPDATLNIAKDLSGGYTGIYTITSENIYAALPSNQLLRPWDNVPKKALAQEITGNRVVYGNYTQGYNMLENGDIAKPFIDVNYRQRSYTDDELIDFSEGKKSLKTYKNYQIGIVYGDEYGRETPVFTSQNASIKIPWDNDDTVIFDGNASRSTQLTAQLNGKQPDFAAYYKFFVKETSGEYYNLTMDRIYRAEDAENLWISFPSSDVNKVQKEEYIILKKKVDLDEQVPEENKYKVIDIKSDAPDFIKFDRETVGSVGGTISKVQALYTGYSTGVNIPEEGQTQIEISKTTWIDEGGADLSEFDDKLELFFTKIVGGSIDQSNTYSIVSVAESNNNTSYKITLAKSISPADDWVISDTTAVTIESTLSLRINRKIQKEGNEFEGRFFVKIIADLTTKQYLESLIVQEITYRNSLSIDSYYLADEQTGSGANANTGVVNTNVSRYAAGATADPQSLTNEAKSNTRAAWETLYKFGQLDTTPSFFLDQAYFASTQPIDNSDLSGQTGNLDCGISGRFVRGSGGSTGQYFVDSIEGIVNTSVSTAYSNVGGTVTSTTGWGGRHWTTQSRGQNNGISFANGNEIDPIYAPEAGILDSGKNYIHISFGPVGEVLYGSNNPTSGTNQYNLSYASNGIISGASFWNHINPGRLTSDYPAGGWPTGSMSNHPTKQLIHPGGPIDISTYNITAGSGVDINNANLYYNADPHNAPYLNQWKIMDPAQAEIASRIVTGAQFRIEGSQEVFTIMRTRVKRLYNHTPFMRTQNAWDGNAQVFREPHSVESRFAAWANYANTNPTNNFGHHYKQSHNPHTVDLSKTLKDFGDPSNRRLLYIIELNKNPNDFLTDADFTFDVDTIQKIRFVEPIIRTGDTSPTITPAIWETQIKEETDLNIYYEASDAIPLKLTKKKETSEMFAPIGSRIWCSKVNSVPQLTNSAITQPLRITNWEKHTNDHYQIVEIASPGLNIIGTDNTLTGQTSEYSGKRLRFFKPNGEFVTSTIAEVMEIAPAGSTNQYVTKLRVGTFNWGKPTGLSYYDCFCFGNGVESNRIRDDFNAMTIEKGVKASSVIQEDYKEENRKNGLIYSGIYNSTSGVNNLNQFIAAEKITKDLNPTYGSIQKLFQRRIDLVTFCEDKVVKVLSNKDALYNADGNAQLVSTNRVLGDANPFVGDYGISKDPASFAKESYRAYFSDRQRGAVLRLSLDGMTPISDAGMKTYFKDNLSTSNTIVGSYDIYKGNYNLTLKGDNRDDVTISYDERSKGWSSFKSFIPEFGLSCSNSYYTWDQGRAYKHHVRNHPITDDFISRNTFYTDDQGNPERHASTIKLVLNDQPDLIKSFNTVNYEGDAGWVNSVITTDQQNGTVNDFIEKEGKFFNYIKGGPDIDYRAFNFQGIGQTIGIEYNI